MNESASSRNHKEQHRPEAVRQRLSQQPRHSYLALKVLHMDAREAVTVSFLVPAFAQLWHVFNLRSRGTSLPRNDVVRNPCVWGAVGLCVLLLLAAVYLPGLSDVLKLTHPGAMGWLVVIGFSLVPLVVGQLLKSLRSDDQSETHMNPGGRADRKTKHDKS